MRAVAVVIVFNVARADSPSPVPVPLCSGVHGVAVASLSLSLSLSCCGGFPLSLKSFARYVVCAQGSVALRARSLLHLSLSRAIPRNE